MFFDCAIDNTMNRKAAGFTIIEIMIAVLVGSILMAVAIPSFTSIIRNNRLAAVTNTLVASINLARSEAVKRNGVVALCHSTNPDAASPVCSGTSGDWGTGWLVFASNDGSTSFSISNANYTLIKVASVDALDVTIKSNSVAGTSIKYRFNGTLDSDNPAAFAVCMESDEATGRQIDVTIIGRPTLQAPPITSCDAP